MNKKYKASKYNHFAKLDSSDTYVGYNFLNRSIIQLENERLIDSLNQLCDSYTIEEFSESLNVEKENIEALIKTGFIINSETDEISEIKFNYRRNLFSSNVLRLIILPTLNCNFDCPYCYENRGYIRMTDETKDNLINWIKECSKNKTRLHIAWFGGEPLLEKPRIIEITQEIKSIAKDYKLEYTSSITTNGFLLNDSFNSKLDELNIKHIQVTFDGNREFHNKSRFLANGTGSFDKLVENVTNLIKNKPDDCTVSIRVNCTDENFDSLEEFLESFPKQIRKELSIFFRWVYATEIKGFQDFSSKSKGDKPYLNLSKLYRKAMQLGWIAKNPHSKIKNNYCEVDFLDHYYVHPEGDLFLCGHSMEKSDSIGSVNSTNTIYNTKLDFISKWYSQEPFNDDECLVCKLLPQCLGGCRKERLEGIRPCIEEKNSINEYIIDIFKEYNQSMSN